MPSLPKVNPLMLNDTLIINTYKVRGTVDNTVDRVRNKEGKTKNTGKGKEILVYDKV